MNDYRTRVHATRYVDCPFSAVIEYVDEALRRRIDLAVSPAPLLSARVRMRLRVVDDLTDPVRRHDALLVAWRPAMPRLFPAFRGALTVRPKGRGAWLRIRGSYQPPFGTLGRLFDAVAGRTLALRTLDRLLQEIVLEVEAAWQTFRARRPA